jgi:hypothetical protein
MVLTGSNPVKKVWVDKTEEKGSDVNLAAHLLHDAFKGAFETAVLVTNDSDLLEPVRIVGKDFGFPMGILNPHQHHSCTLKQYATFVRRIRQSDVAACQFPNPCEMPRGNFTSRPHGESVEIQRGPLPGFRTHTRQRRVWRRRGLKFPCA